MARCVAFLRGMNVGGHRASGDELRACFEEMGLEDVATFRTSGNVIFTSKGRLDTVARRIETGLAETLGYEVPVFARTAAQTRAIAGHQPFSARRVKASEGKLQVSLLTAAPAAAAKRKVLALASDWDRLALHGSELYWLPSGGILDSDLDLNAIDAFAGVSTRRTMGTIEQLAAKFFA